MTDRNGIEILEKDLEEIMSERTVEDIWREMGEALDEHNESIRKARKVHFEMSRLSLELYKLRLERLTNELDAKELENG